MSFFFGAGFTGSCDDAYLLLWGIVTDDNVWRVRFAGGGAGVTGIGGGVGGGENSASSKSVRGLVEDESHSPSSAWDLRFGGIGR